MLKWTTYEGNSGVDVLDQISDYRLGLTSETDVSLDEANARDQRWWSVLIELENISINQFCAEVSAYESDLLIPVAYDQADREKVLPRQPVAIYARRRLIKVLNQNENQYHVASLQLGALTPIDTLSFDPKPPRLKPINVPDDTVVTAVVDFGIAIGHDCLRKGPTSTRVEYASILGAKSVSDGSTSVGRVLERREIDRQLSDWQFSDLLDEDGFYQSVGIVDWNSDYVSPVAMNSSHGTSVVSLAAGIPMRDACENRPVICVSLPAEIVEDTTGRGALPTLYLAFQILSQQAARFRCENGSKPPVVFNFSFGNSGGPHDGTGPFSSLFEYVFGPHSQWKETDQTAWLTLPAGNLNLSRLHAQTNAKDTHLDLVVMPDDQTPTFVEMWLPVSPPGANQPLTEFRVETPSGQMGSIPSTPGAKSSLVDDCGREIARLACQRVGVLTDRVLVTLSISATATLSGRTTETAPQGVWAIDIEQPDCEASGPIEIWILRDEAVPGLAPNVRQSWFGNEDYKRFDKFGAPLAVDPPHNPSPVRRSGTLSGFACGPTPVVVASFTERDAGLSDYSASGPLSARAIPPDLPRTGPDLAAKADISNVVPGVLAAGSRSGSWSRISGTSAASPKVAQLATQEIADWQGSARDWVTAVVQQRPFYLRDKSDVYRAGAGGVRTE